MRLELRKGHKLPSIANKRLEEVEIEKTRGMESRQTVVFYIITNTYQTDGVILAFIILVKTKCFTYKSILNI